MARYFEKVDSILQLIQTVNNPATCFEQLLALGLEVAPSPIWERFTNMDLTRDIAEAKAFLQEAIADLPEFNALYLGLDTLNMEDGHGFNVEMIIGVASSPAHFYQESSFESESYSQYYLIKSLADVEGVFQDEQWIDEAKSAAEYYVFLAFSGIVFREALMQLETECDFVSVWGFHDGDIFPFITKTGTTRTMAAIESAPAEEEEEEEEELPGATTDEEIPDLPAKSSSPIQKLLQWLGWKSE